jgi:acyl carrier protein
MELSEALQEVNNVFIKTLGNKNIQLRPETVAADVEDWDSLNHVLLVVAIEKHFKIRFTSAEILSWQNVGDMCASVVRRTGPAAR